jgi:hypothetical protein
LHACMHAAAAKRPLACNDNKEKEKERKRERKRERERERKRDRGRKRRKRERQREKGAKCAIFPELFREMAIYICLLNPSAMQHEHFFLTHLFFGITKP